MRAEAPAAARTVDEVIPGTALWHPQAHMPSTLAERLTIVSGSGAYLTTSSGRRLLDATSGLWYANIGHGRAEMALAAYDQMRRLETYHLFGRFANEPALRLADRLAAIAPVEGSKVAFTSGGSDSVDLACKLARRHWQLEGRTQKSVVLSRTGGYHGLHGFGTSIVGLPYNREGYGSESLVPETARIPTHDLDAARTVIREIGPDRIAAVITEPVLGTGGVRAPQPGYLEGLQQLAVDNEILFIVDEVITGFGRMGRMFACERWGLRPDIVTIGKGVTSGYAPLGGAVVSPRVVDRFFAGPDSPVFRHGLTFAGHATACVIAEKNLDVLRDEQLVERAATLESVLDAAVEPLRGHPLVAEVRSGCGFFAGVELVPEVAAESVAAQCIEAGVILRSIDGNTVQICPPFVVTAAEITRIVTTVGAVLSEVRT